MATGAAGSVTSGYERAIRQHAPCRPLNAPGPKRTRLQKALDFGLFETRDPNRPGWRMVDDE